MPEQLEIQDLESPMPRDSAGGGGGAGEEGPNLGQLVGRYWALIKKYFWVLILFPVITVTAGYFWTQEQPEIYEARSKVIFHQSPQNVLGEIERVEMVNTGGQWGFENFWNTQKEIFSSQWFGERVVKRAGLVDEPGMVPEDSDLSRDEKVERAAKRVLGMGSVELKPGTRVVTVTATAQDPELAKLVSNSLAAQYVEYIEGQQEGGMSDLVSWFDDYVSKKRKDLESSQKQLHKFKRDQNILSLSYENRTNLTAASMESIREQLLTVRGKLFEKRALLEQIRAMEQISDGNEQTRAVAELVDSQSVSTLAGKEAGLEQSLASLELKYGEKHPEIRTVNAELAVIRKHIDQEINKIRSGIENKVAVLERNEAQLQTELDRLKEDIFELNELGMEYNQLKDRAENQKQLYETVLKRSAELDINSMYDNDLAQVLEEAEEPKAPISPNMPLNLAVALGIGLALGTGTIVLIDALDTSVRTKEDVSRYTNKPVLAMLPNVDRGALRGLEEAPGDSPLDMISHLAPKSSYAEGIKTLRTNLMFMSPDNPPKLLLVTSPGPGEGKTSSSTNMAIAMAQSGQKTLIVDSDMRRPRLHKAFGIDKDQGLSTIITSQAHFDDVVVKSGVENLDVLTCGEVPPNPSELLHTDRFKELVDELDERYDRVIFDSPPLAAVSDALVLSHQVDGVLLILKFGQTKKELLARSVEQLRAIGAPLMGCVLNDIRASESGYAYSYYYRYRYDEHESEDDSSRLAS